MLAVLALMAVLPSTNARIALACTSTITKQEKLDLGDNENGWKETTVCAEALTWLDVATGINIIALQLTGGRKIVSLGAAPSLGIVLGYKPPWWTATDMLIGGELSLAMTLINAELAAGEERFVEIWTVLAVNLFGWMAVGIGGRYGLSVTDAADDFARLCVTAGLRLPL